MNLRRPFPLMLVAGVALAGCGPLDDEPADGSEVEVVGSALSAAHLATTNAIGPVGEVELSKDSLDWVHWGDMGSGVARTQRKANVTPQISFVGTVPSAVHDVTGGTLGLSWTGGTPVGSATDVWSGVTV